MKNTFTIFLRVKFILLLSTLYSVISTHAQYNVTLGGTATDLANTLVGEGVEISGATLNCNNNARGTFGGIGDLGIDSGIVLTSGTANTFGPYVGWGNPSVNNAAAGDADLNTLVTPLLSLDACILEFDLIPQGDTIGFNYVFGSAEYGDFSCGTVNDVFGFFISGPGIVGSQNIAVIPGTTIPVSVNSTTGVGAWVAADPGCTSMGPGSPFSGFYTDNTSGAFIRYGGFTTVFRAEAAVSPCNSYHLKLAIGDVGDRILDSGVFLEAGSLTSNNLSVTSVGGAGMSWPNTNAVRGCTPAAFTVTRTGSTSSPVTLDYILTGTAVNGIDYDLLPGSITIPSGSTEAQVLIDPIVFATLVGTRTVIPRIINPFSCGDTITADTIYIYDSLHIISSVQDTAICIGQSVNINITTHPYFDFAWNDMSTMTLAPDVYNVAITPTVSSEYIATVNVYGSGCENVSDTVSITVLDPGELNMEDSTSICSGESYYVNPTYTSYSEDHLPTISWTPSTSLSDGSIINPYASPTSSTTYVVNAGFDIPGCSVSDTIYIEVNPEIHNFFSDTICASSLPYIWEGVPFSSGGEDLAVYTTNSLITGCDSSVHLNLYINPTIDAAENIYICENQLPYTWNGISIITAGTSVGSYTTSSFVNGCDSTTSLNLLLLPNIESLTDITICESLLPYTWNGISIASGGASVATYTTPSLLTGCDSTTTLNLFINEFIEITEINSICANELPYAWNGISVSVGGASAASFTMPSTVSGCDSTTVLNLTINPLLTHTFDTTICDNNLPLIWNGISVSSGGLGVANYTSLSLLTNCDSTTTLNLTVIPEVETSVNITICENELPYSWNGITIGSGGMTVATHTELGTSGCDSITTLNLTVNPIVTTVINESICAGSSFTFYGDILTTPGIYSHTLLSSTNCDSIIELNLNINDLISDTTDASICSGSTYDFHGTLYTDAGTYEYIATSGICDTIFVLNLAINDTIRTFANETLCNGGSITIEGLEITTAGDYPFHFLTTSGCDSLHTVTIDIAPIVTDTTDASICSGTSYDFHGTTYTDPGTYDYLATSGDCDTLFVLNLAITDTIRTYTNETLCNGGSLTIEGVEISTAGDYPFHFVTLAGCDSLHTVTIDIAPIISDTTDAGICSGTSYNFHGTSYTDPGTYDFLATSGDCDTLFVLNLAITDTIRTYANETLCNGGSITIAGVEIYTAGDYPFHFVTLTGCDSLHTVTIDIAPIISDTTDASICSGISYDFHGTIYTDPGTYDFLATSGDCDTLFILNLAITDTIRTYTNETLCNGGSITIEGLEITTAGDYPFHFLTTSGCDSLHTVTIDIAPIITDTTDAGICSGTSYDFHGTIYTDPGTYNFLATSGDCDTLFVLNLAITDTIRTYTNETLCNGGSITIEGIEISTAGDYPFHFVTLTGCDSLHTITIDIAPIISDTTDATICSGTSYDFHGTNYTDPGTYDFLATSGDCDTLFVLNLAVTDTIRTYESENICAGGSITIGSTTITSSGVYPIHFITEAGCDSLHTITVTVDPIVTDTTDAAICSGNSYLFYGTYYNTTGTYTYSSLAAPCDTLFVLNLVVTDTIRTFSTENICQGGSLTFGTSTITAAGTYYQYALTGAGCDSVHTLTVTVDPIITDSFFASICDNESYDFFGTVISSTGIYTYIDESGVCDTARILNLIVHPTFSNESNLVICSNDLPYVHLGVTIPVGTTSASPYTDVTFSSIYGCDSVITINLTINDTNVTNLDTLLCYGTTLNFGDITINSSGDYSQTLNNTFGCDSVVNISVTYSPQPLNVDSAMSGCGDVTYNGNVYYENASFVDTFFTSIGCDSLYRNVKINVLYEPHDTIAVNICEGEQYDFNGSIYNSSILVTQHYLYHNGCDSTITLNLTVMPKPVVRLLYTPIDELFCVLDTITLIGNGALVYDYFDKFNALIGQGDQLQVMLTNDLNNYYVIGYDENGCSSDSRIEIHADPCCEILIPNAFTPNGDGLNDGFGVVTDGNPEEFRIEVFNRWGERVFVSYNPSVKWNGTFNGKTADAGTYFYTVQGRCYDGSIFRQKGDVTLIR